MARNYTDAELNEAIAKLIRQSIRREYGALGNRKTGTTFSDVQDAAIGVFVLQANAPYYVVRLGVDLVGDYIESGGNYLVDLIDTVRATNRRVRPIENISSLANARSALRALSGATATRDTSLVRINDVPAYRRFDQSTTRFLTDSGKEVRSGGDIVQTPQEARSRLAGLVSSLQEAHEEILRRVQLLMVAVDDYDTMNLPSKFSNAVISNCLSVVEDRFEQLSELTPEERLGVMRDVVLDVLATRSTVRGFGALEPTQTFVYFEGEGGPYADASHPAVAATVLSEYGGPYTVIDDTRLDFLVNGGIAFSVDVPTSYLGTVESFIIEPYNIDSGTPGEENNKLFISVSGWALLTVTLADGATQDAQDIADDINAVVGARPIVAEPYGPQLYLQGEPIDVVDIMMTSAKNFERFVGDWTGVDIQVGDYIEMTQGNPANVGWWGVTDISGLPARFRAAKTFGSPVQELGGTAVIDMNRGKRAVRVRFTDAARQAAVDNRWSIGVPVRTTPAGDADPIVERTQNTLGLPYDSTFQSEGTRAADVATFINDNPIIAPSGTAVVEATTEFGNVLWNDTLRSDPFDSTKVILSKLQGQGDITNLSFVGPVGTVTLENLTSNPLDFNVQAGDVLVIRSVLSVSPTPKTDQVGLYGTISLVTATQIVVTLDYSGVTLSELGDVLTLEIGPDLSSERIPMTLVVDEGQVNQGTYAVGFIGGVDESGPPWELGLERPLIQFTELGSQPHSFTGQVGRQCVRFTSQSTLLDTYIEVLASSPAIGLFWGTTPVRAVGETEWFSTPEDPTRRLEEGDYLELHDDPVATPTYSIEIENVGSSPNVLQLVSLLNTDVGPWNLRQDVQTPYGKVRKRKRDNYDQLQANLEAWLEQDENDTTRYYRELRRLINPLVVNKNPKASDVNTAVLHLQSLQTQFTNLELYLSLYEAPLVEEVDVLIDSYVSQGAQRAVDILLEARFSDFFGLDQDESSYSGDLQKAVREVNIQDLPQRKIGRNPGSDVIEQYEDVDYEFNFDDVEDEEIPIPGEVSEFIDSTS